MAKGTTMTAMVDRGALTDAEMRTLTRLLDPAQSGDAKALAALRPLVDKGQLWRSIGDLTRRVEEAWLEAMTGRNALVREAYERRADELRRELLAAGDSPLERLLVDRVVACWLQVAHADTAHASLLKQDSYTYREGAYRQDRQDRAHARFLKAVKALATVRRLLVPAVQVNIGKNQIISQASDPGSADERRA